MKIPIQKLHKDAKLPTRAKEHDAGLDVYALDNYKILTHKTVAIQTGVALAVPPGYYFAVVPRSGMSLRTPIRIANSPGTIDAGYRDEVKILLHNTSEFKAFRIKKGERIAQLILRKIEDFEWEEVSDIKEIPGDRGGGFGSTGSTSISNPEKFSKKGIKVISTERKGEEEQDGNK